MLKTAADVFTTILLIALAAFLVKNSKGTSGVVQAIGGFVSGTVKAVTLQ